MTETDELKRMLDERGVKWWVSRYGEQIVIQVDGVKWFADDGCRDGMLELSTIAITPEQAIAATLGVVDKGEPQGADGNLDRSQIDWLRFMPDGWDGTPPTLGCGKLTAEQVEPIVDRNCEWYEGGEIDAQAIADELNAALGVGECEWTLRDKWSNDTGDDYVYGYETSCGARHTWWPDSLPNFCPTCGEKVKAVKR